MKKERVNLMVGTLALGNPNMAVVLRRVYELGKEPISQWPDTPIDRRRLAERMVLAASNLVDYPIEFADLCRNRKAYWEMEQGKEAGEKLREYVEMRKIVV